jgi:hypothetical protein
MSTPASYPESANIFPNRPHWNEDGVWVEARRKPPICWCPEGASLETNLCEKCRAIRIRHLILCEAEGRMVDLGKLNDIVQRPDCDFCSLVALASEQTWRGKWDVAGRESTTCHFNGLEPTRQQPKGYALQLTETAPTGWQWLELELVFKGHGLNVQPAGRTFELCPKLDVEYLKTSIRNCEAVHKQCISTVQPVTPESMLIIDVDDLCIRPAPDGCRYIALSYVWGKKTGNWLTLTRDNGVSLGKKNALITASLPQTVRDTMHLTSQLGERYLWVDSLCIVQDDPVFQKQQIDIMDIIYASATMTIVAAAGDNANSGLPGVSEWSRTAKRQTIIIQDIELSNILPRLGDTAERSIWNTRGWTYQERMFSRRCIFLTEAQAFYACSQEVSYERKNRLDPTIWGVERLNAKSKANSFKDFYTKAVEEYTTRSLTSQADVLRAFQGVMNDMSRTWGQEFFFGLPNENFKDGLLWQSSGQAEKRTAKLALPSWSWASMIGPIKYSFTEQAVTLSSPLRAFWLDGQEPERFQIVWLLNVNGTDIVRIHAPPPQFPPMSGQSIKAHESLTSDQSIKIHGRLISGQSMSPLSSVECPPKLVELTLQRPGRLMFQTQHTFLKLANSVPFRTIDSWWTDYTQSIDFSSRSIASILHIGPLTDPIGFIELDRTWAEQNLTQEVGRLWEFLAIGLATTDLSDTLHRHFTMRRNINHPMVFSRNVRELVVNVMLVERVGDLSARLGVGKIYLDCWELADPEQAWVVVE